MGKIAVLGYGVVGSGTVELFYKNREAISNKLSEDLDIKYILDLRDFSDSKYASKFTKDFEVVLEDDEIEVVAEVIGGINPAYDYTKKLLKKGKSVVTSNKELVAKYGAELMKIAKENGANYFFEASVGGGVPVIRPISNCLAGNEILQIVGILNGTTNFVLTKMIKDQVSFEEALATAQELGYAERDPSADVDGHDACRKISILASLITGKHVDPDKVHCSGIRGITLDDVEYAENAGYVIKLIGYIKRLENGKVIVLVSPRLILKSELIASVSDVYNAIQVIGDGVGDVMFYGKGAGKLPTASAVVGDIIDAFKNRGRVVSMRWEENDGNCDVYPYKDAEVSMYVRLTVKDADEFKSVVSNTFGRVIFIERKNRPDNEIAFITPPMVEKEIDEKLADLSLGSTISSKIRVLN